MKITKDDTIRLFEVILRENSFSLPARREILEYLLKDIESREKAAAWKMSQGLPVGFIELRN